MHQRSQYHVIISCWKSQMRKKKKKTNDSATWHDEGLTKERKWDEKKET